MPELPDVTLYVEALRAYLVGATVKRFHVLNPFVLRSVEPGPSAWDGRPVIGVERLGKQIVLTGEEDLFLVIHLMIAGRLRWLAPEKKPPRRLSLATLGFAEGTLVLTEAGTRRRASLHIVRGRGKLAIFDRGGVEPLETDLDGFSTRLKSENHTLKRALTDPRLFSGIGNAYSDEILHRACLSPLTWTSRLDEDGVQRLHQATRSVLEEWTLRLRVEAKGGFPAKVTAFREGMAVHGRYGKACPACGSPVQRIRYADNETNYCARCQTGGRLLADRALSRLLKDDFPKSIDEW
ncbi:MAG: formamidopyrimidine-DNA glycosylase [Gemmatimonadales bacterium]|nr:MAG: formamidopyrimidine-DNA glycosylase [Gemmatimonadales bacterium]